MARIVSHGPTGLKWEQTYDKIRAVPWVAERVVVHEPREAHRVVRLVEPARPERVHVLGPARGGAASGRVSGWLLEIMYG